MQTVDVTLPSEKIMWGFSKSLLLSKTLDITINISVSKHPFNCLNFCSLCFSQKNELKGQHREY